MKKDLKCVDVFLCCRDLSINHIYSIHIKSVKRVKMSRKDRPLLIPAYSSRSHNSLYTCKASHDYVFSRDLMSCLAKKEDTKLRALVLVNRFSKILVIRNHNHFLKTTNLS